MNSKVNGKLSGWRSFPGRGGGLFSSNMVNFLFTHSTKTISPSQKNVSLTTISPIKRGHRAQGPTNLLGRQGRHV